MPAGNAQKVPLQRSLNRLAEQQALNAIAQLGRALPCSVAAIPAAGVPVVTVKFEVLTTLTLPRVTVPVAGFEYLRFPVQVGCRGFAFPAGTYLGGVSGLGGGVADLSTPANLSSLVFFALGNRDWDPSESPGASVLYGPDGTVLRNTAGTSRVVTDGDGTLIDLPTLGNLVVSGLPVAPPAVSGAVWRSGVDLKVVP